MILAIILLASIALTSTDAKHLDEEISFSIHSGRSRVARSSHRASRDEPYGEKTRFARQASSDPYTANEIMRSLLDAHTEYRRNVTPPAADMNSISWNTELADLARGWAQGCVFEHGQPSPPQAYGGIVAQNLWKGTKSYGLTRAVTAWYNEHSDYDYSTASCAQGAVCGHYEIMIYSELEVIGCGSAICDEGRNLYTVCNYGPSVPGSGVPYKAGPPCALCASGAGWCDNKLCRDNCQSSSDDCECPLQCQNCGQLDSSKCTCECKAGWRGTDCSKPCVDIKSYCSSGAYNAGNCDADAMKDCPALCESCVSVKDSTLSEEKCCDGKMCDDGQVLDETSCECVDYLEKTGAGKGAGSAPVPGSLAFFVVIPTLATTLRILIG